MKYKGKTGPVRRWTRLAIDCYKRGCKCKDCYYKEFFKGSSQKCQMKASVLELVRVLEAPKVKEKSPDVLSDDF